MKILAFDTTADSGSIALTDAEDVLGEWTEGRVGAHATWLLKNIDAFLKSLGTGINEVDMLAVAAGPGSFTGLRIGVSVAKGLAWAAGKPVIGVSSLEALSMNIADGGVVVSPVLDARKKEVYGALFRVSDKGRARELPDSAVSPERLMDMIAAKNPSLPAVFLGSGLERYEGVLMDGMRERGCEAAVARPELWHIRASNVALLASRFAGAAPGASELSPVYLRKSEAELKKGRGSA